MKTARTAAAALLCAVLAGTAPARALGAAPAESAPQAGRGDGLLAEVTATIEDFFCTVFGTCPPKARPPVRPAPAVKPRTVPRDDPPGWGPSPLVWPYDPPIVG